MFPFLQRNYFPIPPVDPYRLFYQIQNFSKTTRQELVRAVETAGKILKGSNSYVAIDGKWVGQNPELNDFLSVLMGGHPILITKDCLERLSRERTNDERIDTYVKETVLRWGPQESIQALPDVIRLSKSFAGLVGKYSARVSGSLMQPAFAIYEVADTIKDALYYSRHKNCIVINDDNYLRVIATFACMKEHAQKNFVESMEATLLGPQYFWGRWRTKNKMGQVLFWESKKQAETHHYRELFLQDWALSKKTGKPAGWVLEMREELNQTFNPKPHLFDMLPPQHAEALSKEIFNFSKEAANAYPLGYHAAVERDERIKRKLFEYWVYLLSKYVGAYNPKLVVNHMNNAAYWRYTTNLLHGVKNSLHMRQQASG